MRKVSLPSIAVIGLALVAATTSACQPAPVRLVGPGHPYATPCQAIVVARPGDTIQIDAAGNGTYDGDVCGWSTNNLTITGINGRARIDAAGHHSGGKAIWVIAGNNTTIRNVELSGARVPDKNGAGIRQEGAGLTVTGSFFHDNENGILAGANANSDIVIESSEFARNGFGDGYSHNMYIGGVRSFTLRYSWSHDVKVGHLVKSRALTNTIAYNRITEQSGSGSYEIDLPNGGLSYIIGNAVQQGTATQNPSLIAYGEEGPTNPSSQLFVINNTLVNDRSGGTAVLVDSRVTAPVRFQNNISTGFATQVTQASATLATNCITATPGLVNRATFDYRLSAASSCVDAGSDPGTGQGVALAPAQLYVHPVGHAARTTTGAAIDAGSFER